MHLKWLAAVAFAAGVYAEGIVDEIVDKLTGGSKDVITATATFPEDNPFGHVTNGERNKINVNIRVSSDQNITVRSIAGSFHNPDTYDLIRNTSSLSYGVHLISGSQTTLPYQFHSELKSGDIRLRIWVDHTIEGSDTKHRVEAFDSVVTIVEPPVSFLDWKMLSTYLIVLMALGGLGYVGYTNFFPNSAPRRRHQTSKEKISKPVGTVTATGAGGYEEEWIPAHHIKSRKGGNRSDDALSSGDEGQTKKRKGKKA